MVQVDNIRLQNVNLRLTAGVIQVEFEKNFRLYTFVNCSIRQLETDAPFKVGVLRSVEFDALQMGLYLVHVGLDVRVDLVDQFGLEPHQCERFSQLLFVYLRQKGVRC